MSRGNSIIQIMQRLLSGRFPGFFEDNPENFKKKLHNIGGTTKFTTLITGDVFLSDGGNDIVEVRFGLDVFCFPQGRLAINLSEMSNAVISSLEFKQAPPLKEYTVSRNAG